MSVRLLRWMLVLILVQACGSAESGPGGGGVEVVDSAGVMVVTSRAGAPPPAALVETRRIGRVEGEDAYLFSRVYSLAADDSGWVFVGNDQTGMVRVFDPAGRFVREFGGKGGGPGEFVMLNMVLLAGDDVGVVDWQRGGRVAVFTRAGDLRVVHALTRPDGTRTTPLAHGPQGWLGRVDSPGSFPRNAEPGRAYPQAFELRRLDFAADSASPVVLALPPGMLYGTRTAEGLDWPLFASGPGSFGVDREGRIHVAVGGEYRIDMYSPDGRLMRSARRAVEPVPITDADIDELVRLVVLPYDTMTRMPLEERRRQRERLEARVREQATLPRPAIMPPLGRILVAGDGAFWVERTDRMRPAESEVRRYWSFFAQTAEQPVLWDVFDADGRFRTSVELPARFGAMSVTANSVTGVLKDDLDVEYVVTFRIDAPA